MVTLENVRKRYKDFELNCSMQIPEGRVIGLIGANGAGKSTAFKAIMNLISIEDGKIQIFGKDNKKLTTKEKEQIGVVFAESGVSGYLKVKDVISVFSALYTSFEKQTFAERCREFQIPLDKQIKEFSTGMKRKLQILLALSHDTKLLILDEPTAGLDVVARNQILDLLREYMETEGRSILISSHISSDLENFCDEIYMIDRGHIILHEETDVLLDEYGLIKLSEEQYQNIDKEYLISTKKEAYGRCVLTAQKQYYMERYPNLVIEKGTIDELILMLIGGEKL